ncbi:hypothetical protein BJY04DRAFT_45509 [Aspergillus karnatakaensis]|uniref:uncharacterized protein n=1 Tax=Aspergillus karnatakaensis TaxID=1810916 RepID=UPI003CCDB5D5
MSSISTLERPPFYLLFHLFSSRAFRGREQFLVTETFPSRFPPYILVLGTTYHHHHLLLLSLFLLLSFPSFYVTSATAVTRATPSSTVFLSSDLLY